MNSMNSANSAETLTLVPLKILDESLAKRCDAADKNIEFRFDKKVPIGIEFSASIREEDQIKLTDQFRQQLERYGMRFEKDSPHRIRISTIEEKKPTEITYYTSQYSREVGPFSFSSLRGRHFPVIGFRRIIANETKEAGKVSVNLYAYRVEVLAGKKVVWEASRMVDVPNDFTKDLNDNETLEETVKRRLKPNTKWFQTVSIPDVFEHPVRGQIFGKTILGVENIVQIFE